MIDFDKVLESGICPIHQWLCTADDTNVDEFFELDVVLEFIHVN